MPNCEWLIHEGNWYLEGVPTQTKSNLEYLEANKKTMYDIYVNSCVEGEFFQNRSRSYVKGTLKRRINAKTDWCLNSEDAVGYGLADGVFGNEGWETLKEIKEDINC